MSAQWAPERTLHGTNHPTFSRSASHTVPARLGRKSRERREGHIFVTAWRLQTTRKKRDGFLGTQTGAPPSLILASDWITVVPSERISSAEGKVRHLCRPSTPAAQRRTSAGHGRTTAHRRVPERIPRIKPRRTVPRQFPSRTTHSRRARTHRRARWVNLYRPCPRHHRERLHARFV